MARRWLVAGLVVLFNAAVAAQYPKFLVDTPGVWKPWKGVTAIASARKAQGATAALVKAFEGELLALNAIAKRAPGVATPMGFSVETWGHLDGAVPIEHAPGHPPPGTLPLAGGFTFGAFPIFEYQRGGTIIREDTGETALQSFTVNQIAHGLGEGGGIPEFSGVDHDGFRQPLPRGDIAGLPRYGDQLIIARDPEKLWTPLTLRAALDILVLARTVTVRERQEPVDKMTERLATMRDPKWRAEREKEDQAAAPNMPDPKAFPAQMVQVRKVEEDMLTHQLSPSGDAARGLAEAKRALEEVTAWVAALSPTEQAAQACYAESGATLRAKFRTAPSPGCHPLARPNYAYFDTSLPRSAVQVLIIGDVTRCFDTADKYNKSANDPNPAGCRANRALIETIDKDAIRAWIK